MRNYSMYSDIKYFSKIVLIYTAMFFLITSCSPLKEKLLPKPLVEMEYVDPNLAQQNSAEPDHSISGNLSLELQQDAITGKNTIFASASFHEPTIKNVLFDKIRTNALNKNIYKPKPPPAEEPPVDKPCGIPGFPDCPATATTNPTALPN